ncbi:hypothetical protein NP233_g9381 [Leucocoprinus birnbaumii]|uniref:Uncharacterized protein n=1 Tax=Leucocoprinus birnbaumii TaxID=56174 RepID=A0AAD5VKH8_9AGAR|nr:hypothetical protein NP233_g9381 [Leucocoprinus birnbaumii]
MQQRPAHLPPPPTLHILDGIHFHLHARGLCSLKPRNLSRTSEFSAPSSSTASSKAETLTCWTATSHTTPDSTSTPTNPFAIYHPSLTPSSGVQYIRHTSREPRQTANSVYPFLK